MSIYNFILYCPSAFYTLVNRTIPEIRPSFPQTDSVYISACVCTSLEGCVFIFVLFSLVLLSSILHTLQFFMFCKLNKSEIRLMSKTHQRKQEGQFFNSSQPTNIHPISSVYFCTATHLTSTPANHNHLGRGEGDGEHTQISQGTKLAQKLRHPVDGAMDDIAWFAQLRRSQGNQCCNILKGFCGCHKMCCSDWLIYPVAWVSEAGRVS